MYITTYVRIQSSNIIVEYELVQRDIAIFSHDFLYEKLLWLRCTYYSVIINLKNKFKFKLLYSALKGCADTQSAESFVSMERLFGPSKCLITHINLFYHDQN